jgi:hypothetical protein
MKKLLSIATLVALAALPLAAQIQDDPADPADQSVAQDESYGTEAEPLAEPADVPAYDEAPIADDQSMIDESAESTETVAATDTVAGDEELPRTASPLALIALLGTAGAAAGYGVRRLRAR